MKYAGKFVKSSKYFFPSGLCFDGEPILPAYLVAECNPEICQEIATLLCLIFRSGLVLRIVHIQWLRLRLRYRNRNCKNGYQSHFCDCDITMLWTNFSDLAFAIAIAVCERALSGEACVCTLTLPWRWRVNCPADRRSPSPAGNNNNRIPDSATGVLTASQSDLKKMTLILFIVYRMGDSVIQSMNSRDVMPKNVPGWVMKSTFMMGWIMKSTSWCSGMRWDGVGREIHIMVGWDEVGWGRSWNPHHDGVGWGGMG